MILQALLLCAGLLQAQEISTPTINSTTLTDKIEIDDLNQNVKALFSGKYRQTGQPTFAGGIAFGDGTTQTTAATTLVQSASTQAILSADLRVANTMGTCYASTITFTTRALKLKISISGGEMVAPNSNADFNILMDGAYISPYSASVYMQKFANAANDSTSRPMSINFMTLSAVSAGSHSFCLTGDSSAANGVRFDTTPGAFRVEEFQ